MLDAEKIDVNIFRCILGSKDKENRDKKRFLKNPSEITNIERWATTSGEQNLKLSRAILHLSNI